MRGDGDGWVVCELGHRHWGRYGAAGLLVRHRGDLGDRVVLQHRAAWSHQGDTWGLPGGARNSDESPVQAAVREAAEEAGIEPDRVRPAGALTDDHGGWSYTSIVAEPTGPLDPRPTGGESADVRWVPVDEVDRLPLHPGFAATWPRLRHAGPGLALVVDAANVVGARGGGDGWWRDRPGATRRLRDALAPLAVVGIPAADLPAAPAGGTPSHGPPTDGTASDGPPRRGSPSGGTPSDRTPRDDTPSGSPGDRSPGDRSPSDRSPSDGSPSDRSPSDRAPAGAPSGGGFDVLFPRVILVVEGPARVIAAEEAGGVEVRSAPGSGDDAIVAVAAAAVDGRRVVAVTADRGLAARLAAKGVPRVGPSWLLTRIDPPRRR